MKKTLFGIVFLMGIGSVQAPSLSVAPTEAEVGTIQRGETETFNIYVKPNDVPGPIEVNAYAEGPFYTTLFNNSEIPVSEVSQESMTSWVNFQENGVVADPADVQSYTTDTGSAVSAAAVIPVEISVPEGADPGYHAAKIGFSVDSAGDQGSGFATTNWVLPYISVTLRVPGQVERGIQLENARGLRIGSNEAQIIAMLRNTGTVTTEVEGGTIDIMRNGQKVGEVTLDSAKISPDNPYQEVSMTWESDNIQPGNYELNGKGRFGATGSFFIGDQIAITDAIQDRVEVRSPEGKTTSQQGDVPAWLIVMVLILLGVLMYSFEIDPLWIVFIIGLLSITAFVLMTNLPLYIIGITLILGFLMIYYGLI